MIIKCDMVINKKEACKRYRKRYQDVSEEKNKIY